MYLLSVILALTLTACGVAMVTSDPQAGKAGHWTEDQIDDGERGCQSYFIFRNQMCGCLVEKVIKVKWDYDDFMSNKYARSEELHKDGTAKAQCEGPGPDEKASGG